MLNGTAIKMWHFRLRKRTRLETSIPKNILFSDRINSSMALIGSRKIQQINGWKWINRWKFNRIFKITWVASHQLHNTISFKQVLVYCLPLCQDIITETVASQGIHLVSLEHSQIWLHLSYAHFDWVLQKFLNFNIKLDSRYSSFTMQRL